MSCSRMQNAYERRHGRDGARGSALLRAVFQKPSRLSTIRELLSFRG